MIVHWTPLRPIFAFSTLKAIAIVVLLIQSSAALSHFLILAEYQTKRGKNCKQVGAQGTSGASWTAPGPAGKK